MARLGSAIRIVPAEVRHVGYLAQHMRAIDKLECRAMGREPKQALRTGIAASAKCWTALLDGLPHAMFGVVVESVLTGEAIPWFLGTDEVYRHPREMLKWGPGFIHRLQDSRLTLRNLVSAQNAQAIRLLERWGFTVGQEEVDVRGVMFRWFCKEPR
ncbi:hypothetical protein [Novosphingobium capsulatum]|uniref:hypothetical protein n=1 Tax=Novosphingobium capsulatum TaxID=13688 RepID=UPI000786ED83|nr:hypothetical protein [Novosphingobium capsulatum]WQD92764.1 hypothetical protein U0041_17545 [Novosphingobium capsulatum]